MQILLDNRSSSSFKFLTTLHIGIMHYVIYYVIHHHSSLISTVQRVGTYKQQYIYKIIIGRSVRVSFQQGVRVYSLFKVSVFIYLTRYRKTQFSSPFHHAWFIIRMCSLDFHNKLKTSIVAHSLPVPIEARTNLSFRLVFQVCLKIFTTGKRFVINFIFY